MEKKTKGADAPAKPAAPASMEPPDGVVQAHWAFWNLGRDVAERFKKVGSKDAAARAIAEEQQYPFDQARKALTFALRFQKRDLIRLGRVRIGDEPLSMTHLRLLATVADPAEVEALLEKNPAGASDGTADQGVDQGA